MSLTQCKPFTYSEEDVIAFRDKDHTPFNKRHGSVDSTLTVEVRAFEKPEVDWVTFQATERTTTYSYGSTDNKRREQTRVISFTLTREQFAAVVAHVNRGVAK